MRRRGAVALAVTGLALAPAMASANTKVVYAGGPASWSSGLQHHYGAAVNSFLINRVTVRAGDTVEWNGASLAGGFHNVDIPKLNGSDLAVITATGKTVEGANDAAGNPFWFNGKVPVLSTNPILFGRSGPPTYNGTTRVDSGLPVGPGSHTFKVKFLTPGVYKYFCDVHPGMIGYVVVKPDGKPVPSAKTDANVLRAEEQRYTAEAKNADRTKVHGNAVSLGASAPGGLEVFAMFPARLSVKQGTTVTFFMSKKSRESHTASFGPAPYLTGLAKSFQAPAPAPAAIYPSDPPGHIVLTPTAHGNGFASTGVLDRDPLTTTIPASGKITFGQPGTYHFVCLIHPFMHGTIVVK